jgi:subfamily B ATP-binding cassette protein MsbA
MKLANTTAENSFKYSWLLKRMFKYLKPFLGRAILALLVAIPVGMLDGIVAFALKPYLDYVLGQKDLVVNYSFIHFSISWSTLAFIIPFGVVLFAAFQGVLKYLNEYLSDWTSQKLTNSIKIALFNKLVYMDTSFYDENTSGTILQRYLNDTDIASTGLVNNLKGIIISVFGALSLIAVMLYSSWRLAIVGVVVLCIAFVPVALIRKRVKKTSNRNMVIGGNITTNFNETYSGNRVMRAYNLQEMQKEKFTTQIWAGFNNNMALVKRAGWMSPLMYLIASCGIAFVLAYGTKLITSGIMTTGAFASFVTSLLLLYKPVKNLGNTLTGLQNIFVAMGRVFELFDIEPNIVNKKDAKTLNGISDSIEFKNVNFGYNSEYTVIKNMNLKINKNETLAIIGNSGGGKSTLVNLIPRFYDVTNGELLIDNINIKDYTMESIRNNIAMVFQDNFLFSGTIKENILMGKPDATEEELQNAIKAAHLEEMLAELPDGIDTLLGERGLTLSGGQRQRVAIARAIIKNAPIVILDEATSALDNKSEYIVQKALDNLIQNRTVLVIAHRLSTIKNADRIAVINDGELVELGNHEELMNIDKGHYKTLYEMQFKHQESNIVVK